MYSIRHQETWKNRVNNGSLVSHPSEKDIQSVYSFCEKFNDFFTEFVQTSMQLHIKIKFDDSPLILDTEQSIAMMIEILKEQKFIFIDVVTQNVCSYKGYVSWLILATYNRLYLIDAAKQHDKCYELKQVLMRMDLIKFMHHSQQVLNGLKRDFSFFISNIFDLQVIHLYLVKNGKVMSHPKNILQELKGFQPTYGLSSRPLRSSLLSKLQEYYQSEMNLLLHVDRFFVDQDQNYQSYAYFNNYEFLLKSYYHHIPSIEQLDQLCKTKCISTENSFKQYNQYQEINLQTQISKQDHYWNKNQDQKQIAQILLEWRQHNARMYDINVEQILSYPTLSLLAKTEISSILQISQICSISHQNYRVFPLSLQQFEQIFELFQLHKERKQQRAHELIIPRKIPYFRPNQGRPIQQLFEELKFNDIGNDWLNNKNDESVRLYKEIVSINEFDNSIVEEYIKQTNPSCKEQLSIEDITKYVKYAEYLRNGNHKKLQQLYEKTKNKSRDFEQKDEYYEQNFIQDEKYDNWQQIENEIRFQENDNFFESKINKSFASLRNFDINNFHNWESQKNLQSLSDLKQKKISSLKQLESPGFFQKVEALPENIESIYLEAAKAKKNNNTNTQKKNIKNHKKQLRERNNENDPKRQEQFVPTKEEIFNLIYY